MSQSISVSINGAFPDYGIAFSSEPLPVKHGKTETITYTMISRGFRFVGINVQRNPFDTADQLTWAIPADQQSLILTDVNADAGQSVFRFEIVFSDSQGNQFSSMDPQIENDGIPPT
ncbi:MAG: DP-EP family protein [Xanthomonadales bacterium]|nr:DP-EP family protein [Xanthomonadales bacterium]